MASYLRPRRGKAATAISQSLILKRGEIFFEVPTSGVGTGAGKIKMGDGSTTYESLPYFLDGGVSDLDNAKINFTNSSGHTDKSYNSRYLNEIIPSNPLHAIFTNLKRLLLNYNYQLNNTLDIDDNNICGPSFVLNAGYGSFILPDHAPSDPVNGNMWIS